MTDEQIIKALENCANNGECKDCAINPHVGNYGYCTNLAIKTAIDLINRQKEEILELQGNLKFVRGTVARLLEISDMQQAKIEKLKEAYAVCEETTGLKQARAEAIKEFAERFEERCGTNCDSAIIWAKGTIDNLVKEMADGQP